MSFGPYTKRQIFRRPGRALLTLMGIAFGVASMCAISLTTHTTRVSYREMFETLTGRAELEVVADGMGGFDPSIATKMRGIPGLRAAAPVVQKPAALLGSAGPTGVVVLGVDPEIDGAARDYNLIAGSLFDGKDGVLTSAAFANANGLTLDKPVRIVAATGLQPIKLIGLLDSKGLASSAVGGLVITPLATAQRLFGLKGQINSVHLVLDDGADPVAVQERVRRSLPPGFNVQPPAMRGALAQESLRATEQGLAALSVVSLVAGGFVILNTFLMNLGERRKQLAILRSLGATKSQITGLIWREAAILGVVGTAMGLGLGALMSFVLTRAMGPMVGQPDLTPKWTWGPFIVGALLGPGISLASTIIPARRAASRPPLEELLGITIVRGEEVRQWPMLVGTAMIVAVIGTLSAFLRRLIPIELFRDFIPVAMTFFLVGVVLAMPAMVRPFAWLVEHLLRPLLGMSGRLALRELARHRGRTSLTIGVLSIALVVTVGMGNTLLNNTRDVSEWHSRAITSDFFVRSVMPNTGTLSAAPISADLSKPISSLPGVESVDRLSFAPVQLGKERALVLARGFGELHLSLDMEKGEPSEVRERLLAGEVVIGTVLAQRLGLTKGDVLKIPTRKGAEEVKIAGTTTDYTVGGMCLYMDWQAAQKRFAFEGVDSITVVARPGEVATAAASLGAFCKENSLFLQSNADLRSLIDELVNQIVAFLWLLMAMVFVVASLGIVNTLTMNVVEQTRELGVLRAIAMTRGQLRKLILTQSLAIGLISLGPGALAGIALAYLVNLTNAIVIGNPVPFRLNGLFLVECCAASLISSLLAALLPAERAARLSVTEALQYE